MKIYIRNIIVTYILLPASIAVSGFLTYWGILSVYPDPSNIVKLIVGLLILCYAGMLYAFWDMWGDFISSNNKKIYDYIKVSFLSLIVIMLIFSTSTVFNIVYLSGPISVNREITDNILNLKVQIKKDMELRKKDLTNRINKIKNFATLANELKEVESPSGQEYMYRNYELINFKLSSLIRSLNDNYYNIKNEGKDSPLKIIDSYIVENSYQREGRLKENIFYETMDIIDSELTSNEDTEKNKPADITLALPSSYGNIEDKKIGSTQEETINPTLQKSDIDIFLDTSVTAMNGLGRVKSIINDSVEIKHRKYNDLLNKIQTIMIEKELSSDIDIDSYNGLITFTSDTIKNFEKLPTYESDALNIRKENLYKRYFVDLEELLKKEAAKENQSKEFSYDNYRLNDIFYTVFDERYREIPLITFAFFIDYIPILLMILASIIFTIRKRELADGKPSYS